MNRVTTTGSGIIPQSSQEVSDNEIIDNFLCTNDQSGEIIKLSKEEQDKIRSF